MSILGKIMYKRLMQSLLSGPRAWGAWLSLRRARWVRNRRSTRDPAAKRATALQEKTIRYVKINLKLPAAVSQDQ